MPFAASSRGAQVCLELQAAGLGAARLRRRMAQDERIGGGRGAPVRRRATAERHAGSGGIGPNSQRRQATQGRARAICRNCLRPRGPPARRCRASSFRQPQLPAGRARDSRRAGSRRPACANPASSDSSIWAIASLVRCAARPRVTKAVDAATTTSTITIATRISTSVRPASASCRHRKHEPLHAEAGYGPFDRDAVSGRHGRPRHRRARRCPQAAPPVRRSLQARIAGCIGCDRGARVAIERAQLLGQRAREADRRSAAARLALVLDAPAEHDAWPRRVPPA